MRGRPRVHVDEKARKRAHYQRSCSVAYAHSRFTDVFSPTHRHIEQEQKKARDRYRVRQAQKKSEEQAVCADLARRASLMPQTAKVRLQYSVTLRTNNYLAANQRKDGYNTKYALVCDMSRVDTGPRRLAHTRER